MPDCLERPPSIAVYWTLVNNLHCIFHHRRSISATRDGDGDDDAAMPMPMLNLMLMLMLMPTPCCATLR
jgi:hypothetical protein